MSDQCAQCVDAAGLLSSGTLQSAHSVLKRRDSGIRLRNVLMLLLNVLLSLHCCKARVNLLLHIVEIINDVGEMVTSRSVILLEAMPAMYRQNMMPALFSSVLMKGGSPGGGIRGITTISKRGV